MSQPTVYPETLDEDELPWNNLDCEAVASTAWAPPCSDLLDAPDEDL